MKPYTARHILVAKIKTAAFVIVVLLGYAYASYSDGAADRSAQVAK